MGVSKFWGLQRVIDPLFFGLSVSLIHLHIFPISWQLLPLHSSLVLIYNSPIQVSQLLSASWKAIVSDLSIIMYGASLEHGYPKPRFFHWQTPIPWMILGFPPFSGNPNQYMPDMGSGQNQWISYLGVDSCWFTSIHQPFQDLVPRFGS